MNPKVIDGTASGIQGNSQFTPETELGKHPERCLGSHHGVTVTVGAAWEDCVFGSQPGFLKGSGQQVSACSWLYNQSMILNPVLSVHMPIPCVTFRRWKHCFPTSLLSVTYFLTSFCFLKIKNSWLSVVCWFLFMEEWLCHNVYIYFFNMIIHHGHSQEIWYSSLCCTAGPHRLSVWNVIVCTSEPQTPPSIPLPPPWQPWVCSLCLRDCSCSVDGFTCATF